MPYMEFHGVHWILETARSHGPTEAGFFDRSRPSGQVGTGAQGKVQLEAFEKVLHATHQLLR